MYMCTHCAWNGLSKCHQLNMYVICVHVAGGRAVKLMSQFVCLVFVLLLHPSCGQGMCTGLLIKHLYMYMYISKDEQSLTLVTESVDSICMDGANTPISLNTNGSLLPNIGPFRAQSLSIVGTRALFGNFFELVFLKKNFR